MPFIHIKSLPMPPSVDIPGVLQDVSSDMASRLRIDIQYVTATWQYFPANHYMVGGETSAQQPKQQLPLLVELVIPDFYEYIRITKMMQVLAESLALHAGVDKKNIFIETRMAANGYVFDKGRVLQW